MTQTTKPGAKIAKRISERLPRAATAKTADKASVAVKRAAKATSKLAKELKTKPTAGVTPKTIAKIEEAAQTLNNVAKSAAADEKPAVKRIPRTKKVADPLAVSAKPAVDPLAVKTDVPDPLAKVATPSTAKLVTRRRKPVTAADVRATPAKKVPAPKVGAAKTDPTASGLSPKAVEAIEKAKKAMDAEPPKAAAKKAAAVKRSKPVKALGESEARRPVPGLLTPEQRKNRAELFEAAQALQARATEAGFVVRIEDQPTPVMVNGKPMKIEHVFSVQTKESHDRLKAELSTGKVLLDRFDRLYKEIIAAGGKVVGDLTLDGVVFKYNPDAPAATTRTSRNKPRPATKAVLKKELEVAVAALMEKAKQYGFYLDIANTSDGRAYPSVTPLKK